MFVVILKLFDILLKKNLYLIKKNKKTEIYYQCIINLISQSQTKILNKVSLHVSMMSFQTAAEFIYYTNTFKKYMNTRKL